MQIGLVSHHEIAGSTAPEVSRDLLALRQCAVTLVRHGLQVLWLSSMHTAEALAHDADLIPTGVDELPATCRYVTPCQAYRLGGARLFCVDRSLWQQSDLRTRLFTFLCLLQRQLPCAVLHAWGTLSSAYVGVYTARFLGLPAVVSYSRPWLSSGPQQTFMWQWVARHVAMALVSSSADREYLLSTSGLVPVRVQVIDASLPTMGASMAGLYRRLKGP